MDQVFQCCDEITRNFSYPDGIYLSKINNEKTETMCEICSMLTIKIPERRQWICLF